MFGGQKTSKISIDLSNEYRESYESNFIQLYLVSQYGNTMIVFYFTSLNSLENYIRRLPGTHECNSVPGE